MLPFIHVKCACGRDVRATREQAGATVRCWNCGRDVPIRDRDAGARWEAFASSVNGTCRAAVVLPILLGVLVLVGVLHVPLAGPALGFAVLVVGGWYYQTAIEAGGILESSRRARSGWESGESAAVTAEPLNLMPRALLALLGASALVAPFAIRNGGRVAAHAGGSRWGMLVALAGWCVVPLILAAFHARTRRGLARHPVVTGCALILFPIGLCALELVVAALLLEQGALTHSLCDLLPPPTFEINQVLQKSHQNLVFNYDGTITRCPFIPEAGEDLSVYAQALLHGHAFLPNLPLSLSPFANQHEFDPSYFQMSHILYWIIRIVLSLLSLTFVGLLLGIQAHWLGFIASTPSAAGVAVPAPRVEVAEPRPESVVAAGSASPSSSKLTPAWPVMLSAPPVVTPEAAPPPEIAVALAGPPGAPTILIIDDERAFAHALGKILVGRGFTILLAADATEGLRLALHSGPDLIILDLLLPDRPGLDLCRELRADPRTQMVPIIVATYKSGADDEVAGLTQGADDYLAKPYVVEVLIARIQKQLRGRRT